MTTNDLNYTVRKMGFVNADNHTLRNGDCRMIIHDATVSVSDGVEKLVQYPIVNIQRVLLDTLANMLIVTVTDNAEIGFIL